MAGLSTQVKMVEHLEMVTLGCDGQTVGIEMVGKCTREMGSEHR